MAEEHFEEAPGSAAPAGPVAAEPPQAPPFPQAGQPQAAVPDDGDRALAAIAHLFGWITGVIILVVGQNRSAFVRFHALQALVVDLAMTVLSMLLGIVLSFGFTALVMLVMFMSIPASGEPNPSSFVAMPLMFAIMFPCFGLMALAPWVLRIYAVIRAATGHLYAYPLLGRWLKPGP